MDDKKKSSIKRKIIELCMEKDILITQELLDNSELFENFNFQDLQKKEEAVLNKEIFQTNYPKNTHKETETENSLLREQTKTEEKTEPFPTKNIQTLSQNKQPEKGTVKIVFSYNGKPKKRDVSDFVGYFNSRYKTLEKILRNRQDLRSVTSISRVLQKRERENVAMIGMIKDKQQTKGGNINIVMEDQTGEITVIVKKSKPQLYELANNTTFDEVIGIVGGNSGKIVFANNIYFPDIPHKELKKCDDEVYALFLSDLHVGSKKFLRDKFERFLKWINLEAGSEAQKEIASKTKYLFIAGDLVDGVGIYPVQEADLEIIDAYEQYKECTRLLDRIPKHIQIIIIAGNHDSIRLAEPQPSFSRGVGESLLALENVTFVSNPGVVNIHSSNNFSGFVVLLYHGYSFDYYVANINKIRFSGGYDRADLIMKYLLQKRHVAPTHTSAPYLPDAEYDPLTISTAPDFFITGHIHKTAVAQYKATTLICGSCWQDTTSFQIKVGHHPEPGRVPVANLKTREMKIMRF